MPDPSHICVIMADKSKARYLRDVVQTRTGRTRVPMTIYGVGESVNDFAITLLEEGRRVVVGLDQADHQALIEMALGKIRPRRVREVDKAVLRIHWSVHLWKDDQPPQSLLDELVAYVEEQTP